jgi:aryl-alcohol dehydrogenase-like predicted oxidoreductase
LKESEAAGFFNLPVEQVKAAMQSVGVRCVSAHYPLVLLKQHLDEILPFCKSLGVGYVVCSSPMHHQPGAKGPLSLDDWRWSAGQFNQITSKVEHAGMVFVRRRGNAWHRSAAPGRLSDTLLVGIFGPTDSAGRCS